MAMVNPDYKCPLGNRRTGCACPDCLEWRYQEIKAERLAEKSGESLGDYPDTTGWDGWG